MDRIAFVGAGFMGSAIARAVHIEYPAAEIGVVEPYEEKRNELVSAIAAADLGVDISRAAQWADLTVLAIKPQDVSKIEGLFQRDDAILSVLAGTSIARIRELSGSARVARIMPNLAADIRCATVGLSFSANAQKSPDNDLQAAARAVAGTLGTVLEVPEHLMHAVTALSGSGIAFVFRFIEAMAAGGVREGLPYPKALDGALQVVAAGAQLIQKNGIHPEEMVSRVCSPAGTTIAGITALEEFGLSHAVIEAVHRAAERSRELDT